VRDHPNPDAGTAAPPTTNTAVTPTPATPTPATGTAPADAPAAIPADTEAPAAPRRRRPSRGCLVGLILLALFAADQFQAPPNQVSARVLLAGIDLYQATLSKAMPEMGVRCRFQPTCSHYGEASIRKHGAVVGSAKAAWRIGRCGPWTPQGTIDPP